MPILLLVKNAECRADLAQATAPFPPDNENGLTEDGRIKTEALSAVVNRMLPGARIFTSPSRRTKETAELITPAGGAEPELTPELAERQFDLRAISIGEYISQQNQAVHSPYLTIGQNESAAAHRARVETWIARLLARFATQTQHVVVVGHGFTIEHLQASLLLTPPAVMGHRFSFCEPANAHVWRIGLKGGDLSLALLGANLTPAAVEAVLDASKDDQAFASTSVADLLRESAAVRGPERALGVGEGAGAAYHR